MTYYNEFDPFAAQWLKNLIGAGEIPAGIIDTRSIKEVEPHECWNVSHFFAGIGGWPLALRLANWPESIDVWTGSCPCQPFSAAGKRKGIVDDRHLWPEFFRLINAYRPAIVFGEQVASKDGLGWCDGVFDDLENAGYACGAADMCAAGVGAPHIRQRLFWVAVADKFRHHGRETTDRRHENDAEQVKADCGYCRLAYANGERFGTPRASQGGRQDAQQYGDVDGADAMHDEQLGTDRGSNREDFERSNDTQNSRDWWGTAKPERALSLGWRDSEAIVCLDGKSRRIGRGVFPLAYGIPRDLGRSKPELAGLLKGARGNRSGRLKGYGNAIVPQVAAVFIQTAMEWLGL